VFGNFEESDRITVRSKSIVWYGSELEAIFNEPVVCPVKVAFPVSIAGKWNQSATLMPLPPRSQGQKNAIRHTFSRGRSALKLKFNWENSNQLWQILKNTDFLCFAVPNSLS
jgi:hypothetical protein